MRKKSFHKCAKHTESKNLKLQTFVEKPFFLFYELNSVKNDSIYRKEDSIEILKIHKLIYQWYI